MLTVSDVDLCPNCGADLRGAQIPENMRRWFGGRTHFTRRLSVEMVGGKRCLMWECPDCEHRWLRFSPKFYDHRIRSMRITDLRRTGA